MISTWLDEWDLPYYRDTGNPDLDKRLSDLKEKWIFEFDTVENRKLMRSEYMDVLLSFIIEDRDNKIDEQNY